MPFIKAPTEGETGNHDHRLFQMVTLVVVAAIFLFPDDGHGQESPKFEATVPSLEFAFQITLDVTEAIRIGSSGRSNRAFASVLDGTIEGPRLTGRVIPNTGGDYPYLRSDDVIEFDAVYLLEANDGTPILIKNKGYRYGPKAAMDALRERKDVDPATFYMRLAPSFEVAEGPHDWLTRNVIVGTGHRENGRLVFRYYIVK
jgi:hypothetical protein